MGEIRNESLGIGNYLTVFTYFFPQSRYRQEMISPKSRKFTYSLCYFTNSCARESAKVGVGRSSMPSSSPCQTVRDDLFGGERSWSDPSLSQRSAILLFLCVQRLGQRSIVMNPPSPPPLFCISPNLFEKEKKEKERIHLAAFCMGCMWYLHSNLSFFSSKPKMSFYVHSYIVEVTTSLV